MKNQHIEAIEKIAAKKIKNREDIRKSHESMALSKKELLKDIIELSKKLIREKSIQSVYLLDSSKNILDESTIEHYLKIYNQKKQDQWLNSIKSYYRVNLHSNDFNDYINHPTKHDEKVEDINKKINIETWNSIKGLFFEWFTTLILIDGFYDKNEGASVDLTEKKSIPLDINGKKLFLRSQLEVKNNFKLPVKPDFILTNNDSDDFNYHNVHALIECKNLSGNIEAKDIRDIFMKGFQILPHSICIFSREKLDNSNLEKINNFGIDVIDNLTLVSYRTNTFIDKYNDILRGSSTKEYLIQYLHGKYL